MLLGWTSGSLHNDHLHQLGELQMHLRHPDLVCFTGDDAIYHREIKRLCTAAKELNIPLEINLLGIRYNRHYPGERFWKIAGEVGSPITIGVDAHASKDFLNKDALTTAFMLIEKHNLNYIGMPKLKPIV